MRISWCAYVFFYKFINYTSYTVMQRNTGVLSLEEFSVTINCEIPTIHRRNNEASQRKDFCLLWNIPTRIYGIFSILEKLFSPMNERYPLVRSNFKPILFFFFLFLWKRWKKKKKIRDEMENFISISVILGHLRSTCRTVLKREDWNFLKGTKKKRSRRRNRV